MTSPGELTGKPSGKDQGPAPPLSAAPSLLPGRLLRRSSLRHARQHPWQTWLGLLGIALGVMMVVAVDLANRSAQRAFELSVQTVSGSLSHQILGGAEGVPDALYTDLRRELGLRRNAPGLSGELRVSGRAFTLIGVDPLAELSLSRARPGLPEDLNVPGGEFFAAFSRPDAVLMSRAAAERLGLRAGERFSVQVGGRVRELLLGGLFPSDTPEATEGLLLADIALAQDLLRRQGRLDSIDLILDDAQTEIVRAWLPARYQLSEAGSRETSLRRLTEAFHVNLLAMSLLSLLVAALLIYNAMNLSVLQRRNTLGVFRAQGLTGGEVLSLVLTEALALGLAASLAGVLAGYWLGRFLVTLVTRTIDELYFDLSVNAFLPDPWSLAKGLLLGTGVTLLAAGLPALQAARLPPLRVRPQPAAAEGFDAALRRLALLGLVLLGAGYALLALPGEALVLGFVALTLQVFGFGFLVPGLVSLALRGLLAALPARAGVAPRLALRAIRQGITRTGLAVAALTVAVSVTVGVGVMVGSFRATVVVWLDQSLGGDLHVRAVSSDRALPADLAAELAALPGVRSVEAVLETQVETSLGPARLSSTEALVGHYYLKEGVDELDAAWAAGAGILVSEPFAWLHGLETGDSLAVLTPAGRREYRLLGIIHDYTSSLGLIAFPAVLYRQAWGETLASRLALRAAPDSDLASLESRVRERLEARGGFAVNPTGRIRGLTLEIFDRTFAITGVLRLLAMGVAFVGVLGALMALQLERLREYALLRATGVTPGGVAGMVLLQTAVLGLCAGLLALPLGLLMADVLIDVINRRSFGWSLQHLLPAGVLAEALLLALAAALLAGLYPAWRAGAVGSAALREE